MDVHVGRDLRPGLRKFLHESRRDRLRSGLRAGRLHRRRSCDFPVRIVYLRLGPIGADNWARQERAIETAYSEVGTAPTHGGIAINSACVDAPSFRERERLPAR